MQLCKVREHPLRSSPVGFLKPSHWSILIQYETLIQFLLRVALSMSISTKMHPPPLLEQALSSTSGGRLLPHHHSCPSSNALMTLESSDNIKNYPIPKYVLCTVNSIQFPSMSQSRWTYLRNINWTEKQHFGKKTYYTSYALEASKQSTSMYII